jgi:hypothetical protein
MNLELDMRKMFSNVNFSSELKNLYVFYFIILLARF